jgi:hypothetical protein
MGAKQSKSKTIDLDNKEDLNLCQLEYRSDATKSYYLKSKKGNYQFGSKYVYFNLQKDIVRDHPRKIFLVFRQSQSRYTSEFTDTAEIFFEGNDPYVKNMIDGKEYKEIQMRGQKGGLFIIRYQVDSDNGAYIVYIGNY